MLSIIIHWQQTISMLDRDIVCHPVLLRTAQTHVKNVNRFFRLSLFLLALPG